jgi:hypothetical protein
VRPRVPRCATPGARFRNDAALAPATLKAKRWSIRPRGIGPAVAMQPNVRTWSEYHAELRKMNRGGNRWQLLPTHETEA